MAFLGPVKGLLEAVNTMVTAVVGAPVVGRLLRGHLTSISYVGRKSGRTFTLPVGYRRSADDIAIRVAMPGRKSWWRNFLGAGAPITIELDGTDRSGHAVATQDERGRVTVAIHLD